MADREFAGLRCSELEELAPAFVLGALETAEMDAVRRHLATCPEAHPAFAELGSVVPALFETVDPIAPPAGLKERILAAAAADTPRAADTQRADAPGVVDTQRAIDTQRAPERYPAPAERQGWFGGVLRRPIWAPLALAAAIAVAALGAWNLQLRDELAGLTAYRAGVVKVLDEAAQPGAQLAFLSSEGDGPSGLAAVGGDGSVDLVMRDLAPTAGTQVYEAWLIGADGAPIPVGNFVVDDSRTASFSTTSTAVAPGVTVALSLEPARGATTPTVVVAAGVARAQGDAT